MEDSWAYLFLCEHYFICSIAEEQSYCKSLDMFYLKIAQNFPKILRGEEQPAILSIVEAVCGTSLILKWSLFEFNLFQLWARVQIPKDMTERWQVSVRSAFLWLCTVRLSCSSTVVNQLRRIIHAACVSEKVHCHVQNRKRVMVWTPVEPIQGKLSWPCEPHSKVETHKLTTEVKKYTSLICIALTWKVFYIRS